MNETSYHPKLKPYFPADTRILGKYPYYKFLKNRPKHLQKLQIERYYFMSETLKSRRAMGIHIKRITKSIKSIQNLDFAEFPHHQIPFNVGQDMMKRFNRVKKIALRGSSSNSKLCLLNYLYLKSLKNLQSLVLDEEDREIFSNFERINSKFFRFLRHVKLEKLEHKIQGKNAPYHKILNFPCAPSSIKSWSLSCLDYCLENLQNIDNIRQLLNLNRLRNLKRFQMKTPLSLEFLNQVLGTIPQPEILKALTFKITKNENMVKDFLPITRSLLTKYQGLEQLAVSSGNWIDFFPLNLWRLKSLKIDIQTVFREDLKNLREFLVQQRASLESLDLTLRFDERPETFLEGTYDFIGEIGYLKKLKALRIYFAIRKGNEEEFNSLRVVSLLINVINELKDLKEFGFYHVGAKFEKDFEGFFQALLEKSRTLDTLEVNLNRYRIQKRDLGILVKTLPQLKALEILKLTDLVISDPGFFKNFAETIHRCSNLSSLAFSNIKVDLPEYKPQEMMDMIKSTFPKKNLTHLELQNYQGYHLCEKLKLSEIYEEYPHIQTMHVPIRNYYVEFSNSWNGLGDSMY